MKLDIDMDIDIDMDMNMDMDMDMDIDIDIDIELFSENSDNRKGTLILNKTEQYSLRAKKYEPCWKHS